MISISQPLIDHRTEMYVLEVLRSGHLTAGPRVAELERRFAELAGTKTAVAVSSGTAALETALGFTVGPGDVVLTTPLTFAATLNAALRSGAVVRFVDIDENFNLDAATIEDAVDARTTVVMPVHLYGRPCDMEAIEKAAIRHGLVVIEDAAQAAGATVSGRAVGSWGIGCFSLYATKNVAAGEGGVITTNDEALSAKFRMFVNQGSRQPYSYEMVGTNRRLTDLHAAVALPQMDDLLTLIAKRRRNAQRLTDGLADVSGVITPADSPGHVYHQYTIRVTDEAAIDRDGLRSALGDEQIATGIFYPRLVHDYPCYSRHPRVIGGETPMARRVASQVLSLPVHPALSDSDLSRIIEVARKSLHA